MTIEELRELMAIHNRLAKITSKYSANDAGEVRENAPKTLSDAAFMAANSVSTFLDEARKEYIQLEKTAAENVARRHIEEAAKQTQTAGPFQLGTPVPLASGNAGGH